jgi:hypothetical protein
MDIRVFFLARGDALTVLTILVVDGPLCGGCAVRLADALDLGPELIGHAGRAPRYVRSEV